MYYSLQNVVGKLGKPQDVKFVQSMHENQYHGDTEYLSSSVLKDYYDDVTATLGRRVLKTYPKKKFGEKTINSMRMGSAIHAYALEGKDVFTSEFPVFNGTARRGKNWDSFKEAHEDKLENIITATEAVKVENLGEKAYKMLETYNKDNGRKIETIYNECSIFADYGPLKLKVRPDRLIIYEDNTFEIIDLKTTGNSVSIMSEVSKTMENLKYPLSAAMYTHIVYDYLKMPGIFSLAWVSTDTGMCAVHSDVATTSPVQMFGWNHIGFTTYCEALRRYATSLTLLKNAIKVSKTRDDIVRPYFDIQTAPSPWTEKHLLGAVVELNKMGQAPYFQEEGITESAVMDLYKNQFRPIPKFGPVTLTTTKKEKKNGTRKTKKVRRKSKSTASRVGDDSKNIANSASSASSTSSTTTT